ncbi:GMC family oxidoreductase [Thioalkalivibrio sp. HK1]|uniref:GMC family oxidoreductase n=1 Tax=Thioalkalivibrio sp. HK1 TaxID=1469245 RepID=UPI001E346EFD|nr:choline dehydrogenase [Thioalkalivibrio sp. HK1]
MSDNPSKHPVIEADYVIAGAGSAGCVLAARLSEDPQRRVILLEAGGEDSNPWIHVPVGYFKTMHNPATDWCYRTEPEAALNGRSLDWPRGKVLGGSSSINGLLYVRGQAQDFDHWRQLGNRGWSFEDVLPYFIKAEDQERGASSWHGVGGPLAISDMRTRRDVCDAFIAGAEEVGIPRNDDINAERQEGAGYFQLTARKGRRCSTARGYLRPARRRPNLQVITGAHVHRIEIEGKRAVGVRYSVGNEIHIVRARAEVILCAGAIGSPQILQLSGIGAAQLLRDRGIDIVHDLPGVGENLQDHLQLRSVYRCTRPTLNDEVNNPLRKMMIGLRYILDRSGPMSMGASQVYAFARTRLELDAPDVQFHFQPLSADKPGEGLHRFSAFTASVCQLRPESRGSIRIKHSDPFAYPAIEPNYLATDLDRQTAIAGIRLTREIVESDAMRPFVEEELLPGAQARTDEELLAAARDIAQTIYHPVGTCAMGPKTGPLPDPVVDEALRVHGMGALRVVDASVMPVITSGNTNAPTIMIAEKAADMIRSR